MANKRARTIAVVVSVIAIAGIVGFVLYRRRKAKKAAEQSALTQQTIAPSVSSAPSAPPPPKFTFPFKTEAEGNRFRAWVNDNYPMFAKSIQLDRTGKLNKYVQRAWESYGGEYIMKMPAASPNYVMQGSGSATPPSFIPKIGN
jgi:hypothetical protein